MSNSNKMVSNVCKQVRYFHGERCVIMVNGTLLIHLATNLKF